MIAVDTNILVYAHRQDSPWHNSAYECVKKLSEGFEPWLIAWQSIREFIAVVTHPKIYSPPSTLKQSFEQIEAWIASPSLTIASEGLNYLTHLKELSQSARISGALIHDAHIASICFEYETDELWSADRDFSRFSGIRVRNPL